MPPPARLPFRHSPGRGIGPPAVSRHAVSTLQVCCLFASGPSFLPSLIGPRGRSLSERPKCHGARGRLCRRAAVSGPSFLQSRIGLRDRAAHSVTTAGSVWPAPPLSPFRPGRCRLHADTDTNIQSGRGVRQTRPATSPSGSLLCTARALHWCTGLLKLMYQCRVAWFNLTCLVGFTCLSCPIDDSCKLSLAPSICSPAQARQAIPAHPLSGAAGLTGDSVLPSHSFFLA